MFEKQPESNRRPRRALTSQAFDVSTEVVLDGFSIAFATPCRQVKRDTSGITATGFDFGPDNRTRVLSRLPRRQELLDLTKAKDPRQEPSRRTPPGSSRRRPCPVLPDA